VRNIGDGKKLSNDIAQFYMKLSHNKAREGEIARGITSFGIIR